jgi:uncharacterized membrane protein
VGLRRPRRAARRGEGEGRHRIVHRGVTVRRGHAPHRRDPAVPDETAERPDRPRNNLKRVAFWYAAYVAVLGAAAAYRWHLWTYGTDTGTFAQVVADAFGGFHDGPEQGTHFRFHWAPIVGVLWPLVAIFRTPLALQLAQTALVGACVFPLYALARAYLSERVATYVALVALLYPPLLAVGFTEFHEVAFLPVLALALVWAADGARWGWFAAAAVASALIREDACIVLACVGMGLAIVGALRRNAAPATTAESGLLRGAPREPARLTMAGVGLAAVNVLALGFYYGYVIPHVGSWEPSRFYDYPFAQGPVALVVALLTHPAYAARLLTIGRLTYVLEALAPLAFLPLFSWWGLLALPGAAIVLLSSDGVAWRMGSHYAALWIPWVLVAALAALVRIEARKPVAAGRWAAASVAVCVVFFFGGGLNPTHALHYLRAVYPTADAEKALALVPPGARLLTHDEWFAHVALRYPEATVFYCPYVDYVVYASDFPNGYFQSDIKPALAAEVAVGRARAIATFGNVTVYHRTPQAGARIGTCVTPGNTRYRSLRDTLAIPR